VQSTPLGLKTHENNCVWNCEQYLFWIWWNSKRKYESVRPDHPNNQISISDGKPKVPSSIVRNATWLRYCSHVEEGETQIMLVAICIRFGVATIPAMENRSSTAADDVYYKQIADIQILLQWLQCLVDVIQILYSPWISPRNCNNPVAAFFWGSMVSMNVKKSKVVGNRE